MVPRLDVLRKCAKGAPNLATMLTRTAVGLGP